jgi:hypothetical protein
MPDRLLLDRQKGLAGRIGWLLCYNLAASITNRLVVRCLQ